MKYFKYFLGLYTIFFIGCDNYKERPSVTIDFNKAVINSNDSEYFIDSIYVGQYNENKTFLSVKRARLDINNLNAHVSLYHIDTVLFRVKGSLKDACMYSNLDVHVFLRNINLKVSAIEYAGTYYLCDADSSINKTVEGKL